MGAPMIHKFECPHCGQHLSVESQYAGQSAPCPSCNKSIVIPAAPIEPPPLLSASPTPTVVPATVSEPSPLPSASPTTTPRVLLIDTETTGFAQRGLAGVLVQPRIVSVTWFIGPAHEPTERLRTFVVRPDGFNIPPLATAVHRISTEHARAHGTSLAVVLQQLREDIITLRPQFVIAHNAGFDIPVVEGEFQRLGQPCPISQLRAICTMRTTVALCRIPRPRGSGFKHPKLQELHVRLFARSFEGAHDSAADVHALARCFSALYRSGFYNGEFALPQSDFPPPFLQPPLPAATSGFVFSCNASTVTECLEKQIFGDRADWPIAIKPGSVCFLYNYATHQIAGVWNAVQSGMNLDPQAWRGGFPYQCRVAPMLSRVTSISRGEFTVLSAGRIPNPLPASHVANMLQVFQARLSHLP